MDRVRASLDGATVIVPTYLGASRITRCLDSFADQSLARERFEVVLVLNGPDDGTAQVVDDFRARHPGLDIRTIVSDRTGASAARNRGLMAARHRYVTFVDDDDRVSPGFLAGLLDAAAPDVVAACLLADEIDGETTPPNFDTNVSRAVTGAAARGLVWAQVPTMIGLNASKLVPTEIARRSSYDETLASGEDLVYWQSLVAVAPTLAVRLAAPSTHAVYFRSVRQQSVSRQAPSFEFGVDQRLDVIAALNTWVDGSGLAAECARALVRTQIGHMNRYLEAHPADLGRAVEAVAERRLPYFHYPSLTTGLARDLVVAYAFPPFSDTSALVIGRRTRERGVAVDVLTTDLSDLRSIDESSAYVVAGYVDQMTVLSTRPSFGDWSAIEDFCTEGREEIAALEDTKGPYRSVYSRAMWPASHFLAALHKIAAPGCEWIAEFSDPMLFDSNAEIRTSAFPATGPAKELRNAVARAHGTPVESDNLWAWCELVAYALADTIIFTNAHQRDYMLRYCPVPELAERARSVSRIAAHPTLPSRFYDVVRADHDLDPSRINIGYFGNFYATRGLSEVLHALAGLPSAQRDRFRLNVYTADPDRLAREAAHHHLSDVLVCRPYVPYLEFLNLSHDLDCLLINDAYTADKHAENPYLPSKWSDYAGSGTDIWAIVEEGSTLSGFETRYRSTIQDEAGASAVLAAMAADRADRRGGDDS